MKRGIAWLLLFCAISAVGLLTAHAATFNSTNFSINGSLGDSVSGGQSSTDYKLTSSGGQSIIGNGASGSYKLGQGYTPQLDQSIQLNVDGASLIGTWSFDNSAPGNVAYDDSTNNNNGTYSAGSSTTAGKVGQAFTDTSATQSITVPNSLSLPGALAGLSHFSISGWIRPSGTTNGAIVTKWDLGGSNGSWAFQTSSSNTQLRMYISSGAGDTGLNYVDTTNANLSASTWYHVAMSYDGSQAAGSRVKMYLNGVPLNTSVTGTIPSTIATSTSSLIFGDYVGSTHRYWSGALDQFKITGRSLTKDDFNADYFAGNAGLPFGIGIPSITPGTSQLGFFQATILTDSPGYDLTLNQNNNLTSGSNTIPPISGTIASPAAWIEGTTKGLGFSLVSTNGTPIPGIWSGGSNYAALPNTSTAAYTRTGLSGGVKDYLIMALRLDVALSQPNGNYTNQMTITVTMTP
jgi:hypothetical protein